MEHAANERTPHPALTVRSRMMSRAVTVHSADGSSYVRAVRPDGTVQRVDPVVWEDAMAFLESLAQPPPRPRRRSVWGA